MTKLFGRELNKMNFTILTGSDELNSSLDRYLRFVSHVGIDVIFMGKLGHPGTMEYEMFSSDLWIAEAFNPEDPQNPEGYRTVKKFAGKTHTLLLFIGVVPCNFPKEGIFWLTLPSSVPIVLKIKNVLSKIPPSLDDYQLLEEMYPLLKEGPSNHHHDERHR